MRSRAGDAPILLLDDVLSELDAERAGGFLAAVGTFEQAFLTTTELPAQYGDAASFRIAAATVTAMADEELGTCDQQLAAECRTTRRSAYDDPGGVGGDRRR